MAKAVYPFTATIEHQCGYRGCRKGREIKPGERAIKSTNRRETFGGGHNQEIYYHEECWPMVSRPNPRNAWRGK